MGTIEIKTKRDNMVIYVILVLSLIANFILGYVLYKTHAYSKKLTEEIQAQIAETEKIKAMSQQTENDKKLTIDEITELKKELTKIEKDAKKGKDVDLTIDDALTILKGK